MRIKKDICITNSNITMSLISEISMPCENPARFQPSKTTFHKTQPPNKNKTILIE